MSFLWVCFRSVCLPGPLGVLSVWSFVVDLIILLRPPVHRLARGIPMSMTRGSESCRSMNAPGLCQLSPSRVLKAKSSVPMMSTSSPSRPARPDFINDCVPGWPDCCPAAAWLDVTSGRAEAERCLPLTSLRLGVFTKLGTRRCFYVGAGRRPCCFRLDILLCLSGRAA